MDEKEECIEITENLLTPNTGKSKKKKLLLFGIFIIGVTMMLFFLGYQKKKI